MGPTGPPGPVGDGHGLAGTIEALSTTLLELSMSTSALLPWSDAMPRLAAAWRALWRERGARPDLGPDWAKALVRGHAIDTAELHLAIGHDADGRLAWVWPLRRQAIRRAGITWVRLAPLLNVYALHDGLLARGVLAGPGGVLAQAWSLLQSQPVDWDWLELDAVVAGESAHEEWLRLARVSDVRLSDEPMHRSPVLRHAGPLATLLPRLSNNKRRNVRVAQRDLSAGLADGGGLRWQTYTDAADMPVLLDHVLHIEARSWKQAAGSSIGSRDWEQRFYATLLDGLAREGQVLGHVLFKDEVPIAHCIDLRSGPVVYSVKSSHDQAHDSLAPGRLMLVGTLERYFADGVDEFDFLGDDEPYKLAWTDQVRAHLRLRIHAATLSGRAGAALDAAIVAVKVSRDSLRLPVEAGLLRDVINA